MKLVSHSKPLPWVPEVIFFRLEEGNYAAKPRPTRREAPRGKKQPLVARILNLISVLCCRLGNQAFPKPIVVVVLCRLGNHVFRKPITVVVSFEEPINELGQILSVCDDMKTNFSAPASRGPSLAFCFVFQRYLFLNGPLEPGYPSPWPYS